MFDTAFNAIENHYCQLSNETKSEWMNFMEVLELKKGDQLIKPGQYSDKLYYILTGGIKAFYLKDGKSITDWFSFENCFVCSIPSFFTGTPSEHYIELLEDSTFLKTNQKDILDLFEKHHDFERLGRIISTKTLLESQQRLISLQFETAKQKYLNLLQMHPNIEQRSSLGDIASYIGITLETLSRIRSER